jgi:DNA repair protein RadC
MSAENVHEGHRKRIRQRIIENGLQSLRPHEVLEYLLFSFVPRRNTNDLAHTLINTFGSLSGVLNSDIVQLREVKGMPEAAAVFLTSLPDLFRMYAVDVEEARGRLDGKAKARDFMQKLLYGKPQEEVYAVALDVKDGIIKVERLASGNGDSVPMAVRTVVDFALRTKASGLLIGHNHTSGGIQPSQTDLDVTRGIVQTLDAVGVTLEDHFIFAAGRYFSFEEEGIMQHLIPNSLRK